MAGEHRHEQVGPGPVAGGNPACGTPTSWLHHRVLLKVERRDAREPNAPGLRYMALVLFIHLGRAVRMGAIPSPIIP